MYSFVMEQLGKLEERLLELLSEAERDDRWTLVPRGRMEVAVKWAPVRAKALELVRQRDALGTRVLFAQMSMLSSYVFHFCNSSPLLSILEFIWRLDIVHVMGTDEMNRRIRDQESRARKREERDRERMERLEGLVYTQHEKLDKLEDLVYRVMHRSRVDGESLKDEEDYQGPTRRGTELENLEIRHESTEQERKSSAAANVYPVPSI